MKNYKIKDPRYFQITILFSLLVYGFIANKIDYTILSLFLTIASCLATQLFFCKMYKIDIDYKSSLITSFSLTILLRISEIWLYPFFGFIAIASKFLIRSNNKHLFNPANFAIVLALLTTNQSWVSPSQWGNQAIFAFALGSLGVLITNSAKSAIVAISFLIFYSLLIFARTLYLGDPIDIALHKLQSGGLFLFAFYMISDPKTTPNNYLRQILFAFIIAFIMYLLQFEFYINSAIMYALFIVSFLRYFFMQISTKFIKRTVSACVVMASISFSNAYSFCGFYVAKADTELFNNASKVVIVRNEDKTVITMSNDYEGDPKEFAMVIPVPEVLKKEQINIGKQSIIKHLDVYTAPRLVEYHDNNPCNLRRYRAMESMMMADSAPAIMMQKSARKLGVKIEAEYTVGEYDIVILSAKESDGLQTWLYQSGYKVPEKAKKVLASYIKQGTKFFVAKVNLEEKDKLGTTTLRPLQMAFKTKKFMLPIRLGTVNSKDTQELFVFALTKNGRVETTNYRTTKIPSDIEIPLFVKKDFGTFYKSMFEEAVKRENMKTVFLEYAWDMNWCDPCAADPLSNEELEDLGVFWLKQKPANNIKPRPFNSRPRIMPPSQAKKVFVTRLHVRYNGENFPEDLMFQETKDTKNFQGRYIMRHAWKPTDNKNDKCEAAGTYFDNLTKRYEKEAKNLANITGWDVNEIRQKQQDNNEVVKEEYISLTKEEKPWWYEIFGE